jgi:hypothetical protein
MTDLRFEDFDVERIGMVLDVLAGAAHNPQLASIVLGDLLHGFFVLTAWVLGVALAVLVIAVLAGPYRWAAALRSSVRRAWRGIGGARGGDRRGALGWVGSHAAGFQLGEAVAAGQGSGIVA